MKYEKGERVKHSNKPDWGIGQVIDITDEDVKVFFSEIGEKILKIKFANLVKIEGREAEHPLLDILTKNSNAKYKVLSYLIESFQRTFPQGFYEKNYLECERNYKVEAHTLMLDLLNEEKFRKLLDNRNYSEICKNALQIVNKTNLIFPKFSISMI